jgi:hypothetical protein
METCTGASFAVRTGREGVFDCYITGRDRLNRSRIGVAQLDLRKSPKIVSLSKKPVIDLGAPGTFDENGTSYPCVTRNYLFYTGWMPTQLVPFQNHVGLAERVDRENFRKVSRAPVLERTDFDPVSTGSVYVIEEGGRWRMWYTSFLSWDITQEPPKHSYVIKYAESKDGRKWSRSDQICINIDHSEKTSICRPSVLKILNTYHMWYCWKGQNYRIGYARSVDGISWQPLDDHLILHCSTAGFDSVELAYPNVFKFKDHLYMLYCGNNYGAEGLGLARLPIKAFGA